MHPLPILLVHPLPISACSYTLYAKHPIWSKVIGKEEVEAVMELEQRNSQSFRLQQVGLV